MRCSSKLATNQALPGTHHACSYSQTNLARIDIARKTRRVAGMSSCVHASLCVCLFQTGAGVHIALREPYKSVNEYVCVCHVLRFS